MVNTIQIDNKIPPPPDKKRNFYPYKNMQVGESFFVPEVQTRLMCNNNNRVSKATGMKFVARREGNGVRVWRIE
jgi:hypothetical protein